MIDWPELTREEQCAHDQREHGDKPCRQCRTCCLHYRQQESNADIEVSKLRRKLTALEAAVRAVRDGDEGKGGDDRGLDMDFRPLDRLYALVPEVGA